MTAPASGILDRIAAVFSSWIGYGWLVAFVIWLAGTVFILRIVYRYFLERFGTRIPTIVVFALWTIILMGIAGHYLGYGQPGEDRRPTRAVNACGNPGPVDKRRSKACRPLDIPDGEDPARSKKYSVLTAKNSASSSTA